jgi:hypothetical protein
MIKTEFDSLPPILEKVKKHGFVIFEDGDYDLNIIGIRNMINPQPNRFDDKIVIAYKLGEKWITEEAEFTTDPGRYWLMKEDYQDCAVYMHPQQARGAYKIATHRGYKALRQIQKVKYWRDGDKSFSPRYGGPVFKDLIGLNIHRSSLHKGGSKYVERWSAGCQVFQNNDDFQRFLELCENQIKSLGYRTFTYTLITNEEK